MVYENYQKYIIPHNDYKNETWRARKGYKEEKVPIPPPRRNRDFKPSVYGDLMGMINVKAQTPWGQMGNLKDIFLNEEKQKPITWIKSFLKGASLGTIIAAYRWAIKPDME